MGVMGVMKVPNVLIDNVVIIIPKKKFIKTVLFLIFTLDYISFLFGFDFF